jgi:acetyl-CoA C-acetyltransferase
MHAEVASAALEDAGLSLSDVDGYCVATDAPGFGPFSIADYLGLKVSYLDTTETGGSAVISHVGHAMAAIQAGRCQVVLITQAGKAHIPSGGQRPSLADVTRMAPEGSFEGVYGPTTLGVYAMGARRHMYEFGTTSEQLAEIKVAASVHAQHNPNAVYRKPVTVQDVVSSPLVGDPLHRLDCCIMTDGGGALVVVSPEVASGLKRRCVKVLGQGEAPKHTMNGKVDLTYTGAVWSGARAFAEAGITPQDIDYVSIYDSFTITVLVCLEDLGFCEKGEGGPFVQDGTLQAPHGRLPFNTDGGGLCSNHPGHRGGVTKVIEAVRQLRGEANPGTQVPDCEFALAHGTGGLINRHGSCTVILGQPES